MNRNLLGKKLYRCFPIKPKIFLTNPNDNRKNRCQSKIILGHPVFQLLLKKFHWLTVATISSN